jgi:hypothetical protein
MTSPRLVKFAVSCDVWWISDTVPRNQTAESREEASNLSTMRLKIHAVLDRLAGVSLLDTLSRVELTNSEKFRSLKLQLKPSRVIAAAIGRNASSTRQRAQTDSFDCNRSWWASRLFGQSARESPRPPPRHLSLRHARRAQHVLHSNWMHATGCSTDAGRPSCGNDTPSTLYSNRLLGCNAWWHRTAARRTLRATDPAPSCRGCPKAAAPSSMDASASQLALHSMVSASFRLCHFRKRAVER